MPGVVLIVALSGCVTAGPTAPPERLVSAETLAANAYCGTHEPQPDARRIVSRDAWLEHYDAVLQPHIPLDQQADFKQGEVLWIAAGRRPTAGYQLLLDQVSVEPEGLVIQIKEQRPRQGAMVAQVITSPCLLLQIRGARQLPIEIRGALPGLPLVLAPQPSTDQ